MTPPFVRVVQVRMAGRSYGFSPAGYEFDDYDDDMGGFAFGGDSDEEFDDGPIVCTVDLCYSLS